LLYFPSFGHLAESCTFKALSPLISHTSGHIKIFQSNFFFFLLTPQSSSWDFYSSTYSYQDAAAAAGYTTFSYDRLGVGHSSHPDPIQEVQAPLQVSIAHALIQLLRAGSIAGTAFCNVIGVGHSLGSEILNSITAQYPSDIDAAVLTGFTLDPAGQADFFSGINVLIAREANPTNFSGLDNGYLISGNIVGNQFGFFRAPNFDPCVLEAGEVAKQTFTIGELFTNTQFIAPAPDFKGPIDVVDGENDLPFCQSNCLVPVNKAKAVKGVLYPNAAKGSRVYIGKGSGHSLNLHFVAPDVYAHIFKFIEENGF
jgi:pimeloyl-ACP methyl ester carboxylesterase